MSVHESDGISEVLDDALRLGLTAAGRIAETHIRHREQQLTHAQTQSEHATRQLRARLDSELAAARAELAPIYRPQWWEHAQPTDIERAWQTASQWRELDPDAQRASEHIAGQLRDRYDIDVNQLSHNAAAAGANEDERAQARRDKGTATALLSRADRADTGREPPQTPEPNHANQPAYDTPQRREQLADKLTGAGVTPDAIQARILDDVSQAWAPHHAVDHDPSPARKTTHGRGASGRRTASRQERGR